MSACQDDGQRSCVVTEAGAPFETAYYVYFKSAGSLMRSPPTMAGIGSHIALST